MKLKYVGPSGVYFPNCGPNTDFEGDDAAEIKVRLDTNAWEVVQDEDLEETKIQVEDAPAVVETAKTSKKSKTNLDEVAPDNSATPVEGEAPKND